MAAERSKRTGVDAGSEPVAAVYAKALIGALESSGRADAVIDELESVVVDCLDKLPQFEAILASHRVSHEEKVKLLDKAFGGHMTPMLLDFLKVLSRHGRLDCLRVVQRAAKKQLAELRGRVAVELITATEIDLATRQQIAGVLAEALGSAIDLTASVRPELIGGLLVRVGDSVIDASVLNELRRVREDALGSVAQAIQGSLERFAQKMT